MSVSAGGGGGGGWTQISCQISNHDCLINLSVTHSYQSAGVWSPLCADGSSVSAHVDCAWDHWQREVTALPPTLSGRRWPDRFSVAEGVCANGNSLKDEIGCWGAGIAASCCAQLPFALFFFYTPLELIDVRAFLIFSSLLRRSFSFCTRHCK